MCFLPSSAFARRFSTSEHDAPPPPVHVPPHVALASAREVSPGVVEGFELVRMDIHGRETGMALFPSEAAAEEAGAVYTARGHHQVYYVRRVLMSASVLRRPEGRDDGP